MNPSQQIHVSNAPGAKVHRSRRAILLPIKPDANSNKDDPPRSPGTKTRIHHHGLRLLLPGVVLCGILVTRTPATDSAEATNDRSPSPEALAVPANQIPDSDLCWDAESPGWWQFPGLDWQFHRRGPVPAAELSQHTENGVLPTDVTPMDEHLLEIIRNTMKETTGSKSRDHWTVSTATQRSEAVVAITEHGNIPLFVRFAWLAEDGTWMEVSGKRVPMGIPEAVRSLAEQQGSLTAIRRSPDGRVQFGLIHYQCGIPEVIANLKARYNTVRLLPADEERSTLILVSDKDASFQLSLREQTNHRGCLAVAAPQPRT